MPPLLDPEDEEHPASVRAEAAASPTATATFAVRVL
jgi:hypothetical protein